MKRPRLLTRRSAAPRENPGDGNDLTLTVAPADRYRFSDLMIEATADIGTRPGRLAMTLLGTVLGIGALVATVGFAQTTAGQLERQFDAVAATHVVVTPVEAQTAGGRSVATAQLPWDSVSRIENLAGVEAAALVADVPLGEATVTAVPVNDPSAPVVASPAVFAASGEFLTALDGTLITGRSFDSGHDSRGDRVAMLGSRAAERLGVFRLDTRPSIFIDGLAYAVIGTFDDVQRRADLLDGVVIPTGAARGDFQLSAPGDVQVRIDVGAGPLLARQAPIALSPDAPGDVDVAAPQGSSQLAEEVQADVNLVFVIVSVIALLAGGLGIANVTMLSVSERVGEIGLRRAVGATRRQIAGQFIAESVVVGLLGGLAGAAAGVAAVVVISVLQQWTPVVSPLLAAGGVLLGAVVGLVAGALPARRAARVEPIEALRGS